MGKDNNQNEVNLKNNWKDYKEKNCKEAREQLILAHLGLVKYIAHRMAINFPSFIMIEDIINDGVMGLIQALESFDPARETDFKVYAGFRIRGAILDALRAFDWAPRSLRKKSRKLRNAFTHLENELGRPATIAEVAQHMNMSVPKIEKLLNNLGSTAILSLDAWISSSEDGKTFKDVCEGTGSSPDEVYDKKELVKTLGSLIDELPKKEKLVIALYYHEELTLKEIAKVMDLSESRISQLHTRAVLRIKGNLKEFYKEEDIFDYKLYETSSTTLAGRVHVNRVLIVDDAAFMRLILKRMLTGNGYNVAGEASDVVEAIRSYEKLRPDLVIMDLSMPGRGDRDSKNDYSFSHRNSGIDAIKEIIKLDPNAKILVCSAPWR